MESPEYSINSNFSFDSPKSLDKKSSKSLKLAFDLMQDSPMSQQIFNSAVEHNSRGSFSFDQFEDNDEYDDSSQATHLDESFSFKPIENDLSICLYDEFDTCFDLNKENSKIIQDENVPKCINESNEQMLIGDLSRKHTLPILSKSRHSDLASIDTYTLVDLLNGFYNEKISNYIILDARYPYEFNGGHINGAFSAFDKQETMNKLFEQNVTAQQNDKPVVIIFHCEFSAERGPRLMREFREKDRILNKFNYPNLFYPEIYLLEGGYKVFYENHVEYCEPRSYLPMLHGEHRSAMKFFRKKSKSWEMETRKCKFISKTKLNFF